MDVLAPVLEMQQKGSKLIYEIDDDLFNVPNWNPASKTLNRKIVQDGIKHFVSRVDAMFVTTEALKNVYKNYCEHIYVLPNSIDYEIVHTYPSNSELPVICWQGSTTHERDLAIAQSGFEQLAQDDDTIFKMWCGFNPETKKPIFDIPGAQTLPLVAFEGFYQMFSQVDTYVGLAPLSAAPFNRSKSNLKFLEYTVFNAVTVASNFGPYKETIEDGVTGILVSNNNDWYDKTRMVLEDPDLHSSILRNAKKLVDEKYNMKNTYKLWEKAINQVSGVE
jgi:glycosyltransferase involved in cell wall biosynthesis